MPSCERKEECHVQVFSKLYVISQGQWTWESCVLSCGGGAMLPGKRDGIRDESLIISIHKCLLRWGAVPLAPAILERQSGYKSLRLRIFHGKFLSWLAPLTYKQAPILNNLHCWGEIFCPLLVSMGGFSTSLSPPLTFSALGKFGKYIWSIAEVHFLFSLRGNLLFWSSYLLLLPYRSTYPKYLVLSS